MKIERFEDIETQNSQESPVRNQESKIGKLRIMSRESKSQKGGGDGTDKPV